MIISSTPNISPAFTLKPTSKALEQAIAAAVKAEANAVLFPPLEETSSTVEATKANGLDTRA